MSSEVFLVVTTFASFVVSAASLLFTVSAYRRLADEASETFAVIGADEGNHEARLERLETNAHLKVIPSPSALDALAETTSFPFQEEFIGGVEDAEVRVEDDSEEIEDERTYGQMLDAATNEGMAHHGY